MSPGRRYEDGSTLEEIMRRPKDGRIWITHARRYYVVIVRWEKHCRKHISIPSSSQKDKAQAKVRYEEERKENDKQIVKMMKFFNVMNSVI